MGKNQKEVKLSDEDGAIVLRGANEPEMYAPTKVGESCGKGGLGSGVWGVC